MTNNLPWNEAVTPEVLVVDDHKNLRREVSSRLRKHNCKVRTANSGVVALRLARTQNIAVAVIDLKMPKMDGIELAKAIQALGKHILVIFLTAYDTAAYRQRALAEELRIECWIDKHPQTGLVNTLAAVMDALARHFVRQIRASLSAAAKEANLSPEQFQKLSTALKLPSAINLWPLGILRKPDVSASTLPGGPPDLDEVLTRLIYNADEVAFGYADPAHRELPWNRIRDLASGDLWKAVENSEQAHIKQLAVQLEQAVRRIDPIVLLREHLEALYVSLERLRSGKVDQSDVSACKKKWRSVGIDTLPSFRQILSEWEEFYSVEGPDEAKDEASTGDDDPASSNC